jgi:hypothetical protein
VLEWEHIAVGVVIGMMRSFQRMSEALISRWDRDEARASAPPEVLPCAPTVTGNFHREFEKVKFPEFFGAPDDAAARHDWRIWRCASHFAIIPPTGKPAWRSFN